MGLRTFKIRNGDVWLNVAGSPEMISGIDKANQDIDEMLTTETNSEGFGANLVKLLGLVEDIGTVRLMVYQRITNAFEKLKEIQEAKGKSLRDADERFAEIYRLAVEEGDQPLSVEFALDVLTDSGVELVKSSGQVSA